MNGQRGFTYIGLLFAIAFIGLLLASAGEVWKTTAQREREEELLFVGRQIAAAIASYYAATPGAEHQWPRRLGDLLEDRRGPVTLRHLRRLYRDPMTDSTDWGLIIAGGAIVGIHSRSEGKPIRQANFGGSENSFGGARRYADWRFLAQTETSSDPHQ